MQIKQTEKKLVLKLLRRSGSNGRIVVPWAIKSDVDGSVYKVILSCKRNN